MASSDGNSLSSLPFGLAPRQLGPNLDSISQSRRGLTHFLPNIAMKNRANRTRTCAIDMNSSARASRSINQVGAFTSASSTRAGDGLSGTNARGRRVGTRAVRAVAKEDDMNRRLWEFAERFSRS
jgi:hypothetical protein